MTNNYENDEHHEDFGEHDIENGVEPAARPGMVGNLTEAWRTRPLFKFMVLIIAVFAVGVAAFSFMGGNNSNNDVAHLVKPPNIKEAPGGVVSPYMRDQTELANKERADQAIATGSSAIPTPIGQSTDIGAFGGTDKKEEALNELRAETEQLKKQMQQQQIQQAQAQAAQRQPEQFDDSLAQAMQRQMQQLLEGWAPKGIKEVSNKLDDNKNGSGSSNAATGTAADNSTTPQRKILVPAGTVSYAQMMTEANSDVPGPILAQIVSGPLAGARAIGGFQVSQGYEKYLVLRFTVADKKGKDYEINAIALDPDTTLGGMATEVDERYFVRVILPAAAGFLQGMGQALGQGNATITTNGTTTISSTTGNGFRQGIYTGMGDAAQTMSQFFQDQANITKPLVRVAAGTPMGLFFTAPVYDTDIATNPITPVQANGNGGIGVGNSGNGLYQNASYPGTNITGYGNPNGGYNNNSGYNNNPANDVPYPNYGQPNYGNNSAINRSYGPLSGAYGQGPGGYSQITGYGH